MWDKPQTFFFNFMIFKERILVLLLENKKILIYNKNHFTSSFFDIFATSASSRQNFREQRPTPE